VAVDEGEMLTLDTNHPPRNHEYLSPFLTSSEPLLKAPGSESRAFKERVQGKYEGFPPNHIQISKGNEWKRVSQIKIDLLEWMILSQPALSKAM